MRAAVWACVLLLAGCDGLALPGEHSLLIGVITAPTHVKGRDAIRTTWMQDLNQPGWSITLRFFIGTTDNATLSSLIATEATRHNDTVVLADVPDSYANLAKKTLGMVAWAKQHGFDHVVKADDDSYVDVAALVGFLRGKRLDSLYGGHFKDEGVVEADPNSKWYMRDMYDHDYYPRYAFGPMYFLGHDMVDYLAAHRSTLTPFRVEDAGIAIWTQSLGVDTVEFPSMLNNADCSDVPQKPLFVSPVSAAEMPQLHLNAQHGDVCGPGRGLVLDECRQNRCRCWPPPDDMESCYASFASSAYSDVIPR